MRLFLILGFLGCFGCNLFSGTEPESNNIAPDASQKVDMAWDLSSENRPDLEADVRNSTDVQTDTQIEDRPLRILFVGNSFTLDGPIPNLVSQFAVDAGEFEPLTAISATAGFSLRDHISTTLTQSLIESGGWDVVVLQEQSTRSTISVGIPDEFYDDVLEMFERVKTQNPDARVVLFEPWARHPDHEFYPLPFASPNAMQAEIRNSFTAVIPYVAENTRTVDKQIEVAWIGELWAAYLAQDEAIEGEPTRVRLHRDDDHHASQAGNYLTAAALYSQIWKKSPLGRGDLDLVSTPHAPAIQRVVHAQNRDLPVPEAAPDRFGLLPDQEILIDFGDEFRIEGWHVPVGLEVQRLPNLESTDGPTFVDLEISDNFTGINQAGLATNQTIPAEVTRDTYWVGSFDGHAAALPDRAEMILHDLDPDGLYRVELFASRREDDEGLGRLTRYTVNSESVDFDVSDNVSTAIAFAAVSPDEAGTIVIEIRVSPDGTARFGYIGALRLTASSP